MAFSGDRRTIAKIKEHMHERIVVWNFNDWPVWKHASDCRLKNRPTVFAVQIVDQQESTAKAIFPQSRGIHARRIPLSLARLLHEHEGVFKDPIIGKIEVTLVICNLNVGVTTHGREEMLFC